MSLKKANTAESCIRMPWSVNYDLQVAGASGLQHRKIMNGYSVSDISDCEDVNREVLEPKVNIDNDLIEILDDSDYDLIDGDNALPNSVIGVVSALNPAHVTSRPFNTLTYLSDNSNSNVRGNSNSNSSQKQISSINIIVSSDSEDEI